MNRYSIFAFVSFGFAHRIKDRREDTLSILLVELCWLGRHNEQSQFG